MICVYFGPDFNEANEPSSTCRLRFKLRVEASAPPFVTKQYPVRGVVQGGPDFGSARMAAKNVASASALADDLIMPELKDFAGSVAVVVSSCDAFFDAWRPFVFFFESTGVIVRSQSF